MRNNLTLLGLTLLTLCLSAGTLTAQESFHLRVHVPFNFIAENQAFPAGDYEIVQFGEGNVRLQNSTNHQSAFERISIQGPATPGAASLTFHLIRGTYFLDAIANATSSSTLQLWVSTQEKQLAHSRPSSAIEVATILAQPASGSGGK